MIHDFDIASTLQRLYAVISFEEGDEPDWQGLENIFSAHARIVRITPEGTDYLDREGFLAMTRNLVEIGAYTSFHEVEVARKVERFGDIAQVWSVYETKRHQRAAQALDRGINSIQLIREDGDWFVLGLLWDETHSSPQLDVSKALASGEIHGQV